MDFPKEFKDRLYTINEKTFRDSSLLAFEYQYSTCEIYQSYCNYLGKKPKLVSDISDIPFIPIEFFKNHAVKSGVWDSVKVFKSSGTTSSQRSQHYIKDISHYHNSSKKAFEDVFGSLSDYKIVAILPSYQEQGDSSLISMVDHLMNLSHPDSDYFLNEEVESILKDDTKKILIGVSYALLDLAERNPITKNTTIIETGGMKGRKKEITRNELHEILKNGFGADEIWSEYGMTELQSQGYGKNGLFQFPPWAKCLIRDINDPFAYLPENQTGGVNIIDLANIDTCCFIETKDLGRIKGQMFEILGRFDNSDVRGCNLLI